MTSASAATPSKLEHALALAERGFRVFPLKPNSKLPVKGESWKALSTGNPKQIRRLWTKYPDANIAIDTAGLLVIDEDNKNGKNGADSLLKLDLDLDHGLPATLVSATPSGGFHHFYAAEDVGIGKDVFGPGLDLRGTCGYVVAPGSTIDDKIYRFVDERDIAPAPEQLVNTAGRKSSRQAAGNVIAPGAVTDSASNVERAIYYLRNVATEAIEDDGGDHTTYATAARLRDLGVTEGLAYDLMAEHYNSRCKPRWDLDEIETKVGNAYRFGKNPIGVDTAQADFDEVDEPITPTLEPIARKRFSAPAPRSVRADLAVNLPPMRQWVFGNRFLPGAVTVGAGAPGSGKSVMSLLSGAAIVANRSDITGETVHRSGNVWVHDNEDSEDELDRRALGICREHRIDTAGLEGRLFLTSGVERPLVLARKANRHAEVSPTEAVGELIELLKENGVIHFAVGPLLSLCRGVAENSNEDMDTVMAIIRRIAVEAGCSIDLTHHTVKSRGGDSDSYVDDPASTRGAGAIIGGARRHYALSMMAKAKPGVPTELAARLVRLGYGAGKSNYSARTFEDTWFEFRSVNLWNGPLEEGGEAIEGADAMPSAGDSVGVPVRRDIRSLTAAAERRKAEKETASIDGTAEMIARHMTGATSGLGPLVSVVMEREGVGKSTARGWINEAAPEAGRHVVVDGRTFLLTRERRGSHRTAPQVIRKALVEDSCE